MPAELKEKKTRLRELLKTEETAWSARDYEDAAKARAERLALEEEFETKRAEWQKENGLDEIN